MLATVHIKLNDAEITVDAIKSGLAKDNENVELNCLVLEYNEMPSNIMSNCKKQHYCKYLEEHLALLQQRHNGQ
eukprot:186400-Ditylum_brightwellii.AAC.1